MAAGLKSHPPPFHPGPGPLRGPPRRRRRRAAAHLRHELADKGSLRVILLAKRDGAVHSVVLVEEGGGRQPLPVGGVQEVVLGRGAAGRGGSRAWGSRAWGQQGARRRGARGPGITGTPCSDLTGEIRQAAPLSIGSGAQEVCPVEHPNTPYHTLPHPAVPRCAPALARPRPPPPLPRPEAAPQTPPGLPPMRGKGRRASGSTPRYGARGGASSPTGAAAGRGGGARGRGRTGSRRATPRRAPGRAREGAGPAGRRSREQEPTSRLGGVRPPHSGLPPQPSDKGWCRGQGSSRASAPGLPRRPLPPPRHPPPATAPTCDMMASIQG
jgi:hypothetical protein